MIGLLARLGGATARRLSVLGAPARFALDVAASASSLPGAGRRVAARVLLNQLRFTALQAVPLVILLGGILSFVVIQMSIRELGQFGSANLIGKLIVVTIVRELGPLLTAIAVVGRSGTAITAELATNTVLGEVRALEGMGIDPNHYLVIPRILGCTIAVTILIVLFDAVALCGGYFAASVEGMSGGRYLASVLGALDATDVILTVVKGVVFGFIIGLLPSFHGLRVRRSPTEIPRAVIRGTVSSIVLIFIVTALFVVVFQA
ncbi:MAG: MlaE family ABC transporter permease [Gemmatimonadales bacterium]